MNQLYQNDKDHDEKIQDYGCKYICVLNIYQDISGKQLTASIVNKIYEQSQHSYTVNNKGKKIPYMDKDCYVYNTSGIIQLVSGLTEVSVHMKEVSKIEKFNYRLGYFTRTTSNGDPVGHFVRIALDTDNVIEDPWRGSATWNGGSKTAAIGKLTSYRHIKARLL